MMIKPRRRHAQTLSGFLLTCFLCLTSHSYGAEFSRAYSVDEGKRQHQRLPSDDIWWTANGPDMLWNFKNLHQILPTVNVYRDGSVSELKANANSEIAGFSVKTPEGPLPFSEFIKSDHSTTMGVVVLHKGQIAFEAYHRMQAHEKPVTWSVAKAIVGTLVRILEERGLVDVSAPIDRYLPELGKSPLAGVPVRHILDMASGLDCADDYEDKQSCYYQYSITIGDGYSADRPTQSPYEFAATFQTERLAESGQAYSYSGLNTFVLAWLVEVILDMPFQDALTQEVWQHIGAESDAAYIAPINGVAVTHGGFLSRMRDLARFGLLFTPSRSAVSKKPIISDEHVKFMLEEGDPQLMKNAGMEFMLNSGVKHNIYQWDAIHSNGMMYKGGWAGQGLVINPNWDVVAVFTSFYKDDQQSEMPLTPVIFEMLNTVYGK